MEYGEQIRSLEELRDHCIKRNRGVGIVSKNQRYIDPTPAKKVAGMSLIRLSDLCDQGRIVEIKS